MQPVAKWTGFRTTADIPCQRVRAGGHEPEMRCTLAASMKKTKDLANFSLGIQK